MSDTLKSEVENVAFRDYMLTGDLNFILNSWMTSYRKVYDYLPDRVFYTGMQKLIGALAMDSRVLLAVKPTDPDKILGWIVYVPQSTGSLLVHYCYVKHRYRRFGLGKKLLVTAGLHSEGAILASHQWRAPKQLRDKYRYFYNPCFCWKGH